MSMHTILTYKAVEVSVRAAAAEIIAADFYAIISAAAARTDTSTAL